MAALIVMMLVTVVDITMRLAINQLVLGSVEIVQLMIVIVVFLALPETFLRDQHIVVDAIDQFLPGSRQRWFRLAGAILSFLVLTIMVLRMLPLAVDTLIIGDLTTDLQISLIWYWLPIVVGGAATVVALLLVVLRHASGASSAADRAEPTSAE